jgi:hypothetical protein
LPWQSFQFKLVPHDGSQKSPGHQFGPGCACASAMPPNPKAAAIAADAMAQLANLFMGYAYLARLCARPADPVGRMRARRRPTVTFGRSGTKRCCGPPIRLCGLKFRRPGMDPRRADTHRFVAYRVRMMVRRGHVRAAP